MMANKYQPNPEYIYGRMYVRHEGKTYAVTGYYDIDKKAFVPHQKGKNWLKVMPKSMWHFYETAPSESNQESIVTDHEDDYSMGLDFLPKD